MVPHWLKIAIQTLHETENMANTGSLYRLFQLSTHFLQIEGNGKEGKVHIDLVFANMTEASVRHIVFHLSENSLGFYASPASMPYPLLRSKQFTRLFLVGFQMVVTLNHTFVTSGIETQASQWTSLAVLRCICGFL